MSAHRRHARLAYLVIAVLSAVLIQSPAAVAAWSSSGAGSAGSAAETMPAGHTPTGTATGDVVTLTWAPAVLSGNQPVAGYRITRYDAATDVAATVGGTCAGIVTTTTCTDQPVRPGTWTYTDTPVQLTWNGTPSAPSDPVVVHLT